ncbi:hypothetical protein CPLU01_07480 [Colletotrichum plurivorum]|uniref:Uncharacterized protein n=1 Tax=Colletotrichum plurivorum TaxID=2175906 RepID=A0A8H6KGA1_9PEZI|nr:hypothetical protein CPLU01_07480 [Colletotrichum plurivorum]
MFASVQAPRNNGPGIGLAHTPRVMLGLPPAAGQSGGQEKPGNRFPVLPSAQRRKRELAPSARIVTALEVRYTVTAKTTP